MGDEPSNAELGRRLDEIQRMLAGVVGGKEYAEYQRALDFRLSDLSRDLEQERRDRENALKQVNDRIDRQEKAAGENRASWRSALWSGLLPALVALAGVIATILLSHGGHLWRHGRWRCGRSRPGLPW